MFPYENRFLEPFEAAVRALNPVVAVKVRSAAVHVALSSVYVQVTMYPRCSPADSGIPSDENATAIYVDDDTRIQILDTMFDLPQADKEQCGAFIVGWVPPVDTFYLLIRPIARRTGAGCLVRQPRYHNSSVP